MREFHITPRRRDQKIFTPEEKKKYYLEWERSGESKSAFSKKTGLTSRKHTAIRNLVAQSNEDTRSNKKK